MSNNLALLILRGKNKILSLIRDLKIRTKLIILISIFFVSFVICISGSFFFMNQVKIGSGLYNKIENYRDVLESLAILKSDLNRVSVVLLKIYYETDKDKIEQFQGQIKELSADIETYFSESEGKIDEDEIRTTISDARTTWQAFVETKDNELIPAILSGQKSKAKEIMYGVQEQRYKRFIEQVGASVDNLKMKIDEVKETAGITVRKNTGLLIAAVSIISIFILIFAFFISRSITKPVNKIVAMLKDISEGEGDLTRKLEIDSQDEVGILAKYFNIFIVKLHDMIFQIAKSTAEIASAARELSATAEEMASGSEEQTAQTVQVASSMEEMSAAVQQVAKNSGLAAGKAKGAGETAEKGGQVVNQSITGMNTIAGVANEMRGVVMGLSKNSAKIGDIVNVIDDVADQTNLLALNAAIEAARAGEQGRGFAVVADEVRKLAERTTASTKEIAVMVKNIQTDTGKAVSSMIANEKEVENGVKLASQAGDSLKEILSATKSVQDMVQQIATSAEQQSSTTEEISSNVESIASVSKRNASASVQTSTASQAISSLTDALQKMVGKFKLKRALELEN